LTEADFTDASVQDVTFESAVLTGVKALNPSSVVGK
jgi:hypothetical protein